MATTVDELLKKPFSKRTHEEKLKIISDNKPCPPLSMFNNSSTTIYDKITWLTGCEKRQKIFCWPCLLFMPPSKQISGIAIANLEILIKNYELHERDPGHLEAFFKLQLFKLENGILPVVKKNESSTISTFVSVHIINSICSVIKCNVSNNDKYKVNVLEVKECINYLKLLRTPSDKVIEAAIYLLHKSPKIINDFVDAITMVLKKGIMNEIQKSTYVSIVLNEHVVNKRKSQMSTVLRYVKDGKVCERFIGFTNSVGFRQQHKSIAEHILNVAQMYDIREKLLGLSVDGAVMPASELSQLFQMHEFQSKYFVPCYFHGFGRVLMQSVLHFKDHGLFLETLSALESYFEDENNFHKLEALLFSKIPYLKNNKWYKSIPFVAFLGMYLKHFVSYFAHELKFAEYLPPDVIAKVRTFKGFLGDLESVFLLKIFSKLFLNQFDKNMNFATDVFGMHFDKERLNSFRSNVVKVRLGSFKELWLEANMEVIPENTPEYQKANAVNGVARIYYSNLFGEILDQVAKELQLRQKDRPRLEFCDLFNKNNSGSLAKMNLISLLLLGQEQQKDNFDEKTLESEITVFKSKSLLHNKSVHELMEAFHEYNLSDVFTQLYKVAEFILTLPVLPPTKNFEYQITKLKQITSYSYIPETTDIQSGETSVLCIEKLMLQDLQCLENFHDDVIKYYEMKSK